MVQVSVNFGNGFGYTVNWATKLAISTSGFSSFSKSLNAKLAVQCNRDETLNRRSLIVAIDILNEICC